MACLHSHAPHGVAHAQVLHLVDLLKVTGLLRGGQFAERIKEMRFQCRQLEFMRQVRCRRTPLLALQTRNPCNPCPRDPPLVDAACSLPDVAHEC